VATLVVRNANEAVVAPMAESAGACKKEAEKASANNAAVNCITVRHKS
jgi:hypothetical protein